MTLKEALQGGDGDAENLSKRGWYAGVSIAINSAGQLGYSVTIINDEHIIVDSWLATMAEVARHISDYVFPPNAWRPVRYD